MTNCSMFFFISGWRIINPDKAEVMVKAPNFVSWLGFLERCQVSDIYATEIKEISYDSRTLLMNERICMKVILVLLFTSECKKVIAAETGPVKSSNSSIYPG